METKKTKALFLTKEDIHVSFCKELESYDFVFFIKSVFCNEENDLKSHFIPIVFVDFSFLCACGFSVLLKIKNRFPSSLLYILSEEDSSCFAVQSLKFGADDYLVLPLDFDKLTVQINRALNQKFPVTSEQLFPEFIGESPRIIELKRLIHKYSKSDLPILILGESGTGKSLLAKLIHKYYVNEYAKLKKEYETTSFFKSLLLDRYKYKGMEVMSTIRSNMKKFENYSKYIDRDILEETVFIKHSGYGEMALLFSQEILNAVNEELRTAKDSVQIISAYCLAAVSFCSYVTPLYLTSLFSSASITLSNACSHFV